MGRGELAERLGVNESRVRRLLDKLVEWGELKKDSTNRGTVLTLLRYDYYVRPADENRQQNTSPLPADRQQIATQKNGEQENTRVKTVMTGTPSWHTTELGKGLLHRLKALGYQLTVPTCNEALEDFVAQHGLPAVEHFVARVEEGQGGAIRQPAAFLFRMFEGGWQGDDRFEQFRKEGVDKVAKLPEEPGPTLGGERRARSDHKSDPESILEILGDSEFNLRP
jgi:hypothetical protein